MALPIKTQMKRFSLKLNLERVFNDLLNLISVKDGLYLKARDLAKYCGVNDHGRITRLGLLLALLAKVGLARKHNGCRPIRYTLTPRVIWREFVDHCGSLSPEV